MNSNGQSPDRPSWGMALLGFFLPLVGGIAYFAMRSGSPLRARSAGRGGLLGFATGLVLFASYAVYVVKVRQGMEEMYSCRYNIRKLGDAALKHAAKHDGKLPDLSSPEAVKLALSRYVSDPEDYVCKTTGRPYRANVALSQRYLQSIVDPAQFVLFYEAEASHLGRRIVFYAKGYPDELDEKRWQEVKAKSGIR